MRVLYLFSGALLFSCFEIRFADEESAFTGTLGGDLFLMRLAWTDVVSVYLQNTLNLSTWAVGVSILHFILR